MTQELVDRAEEQTHALRTLAEESVDAYVSLLYAPFCEEALEAAKKPTVTTK
jgi:hypothetical protein